MKDEIGSRDECKQKNGCNGKETWKIKKKAKKRGKIKKKKTSRDEYQQEKKM